MMRSRVETYILREAAVPFFALLGIGMALLVVNRLLKVLPWLFEFNVPLADLAVVLLHLVPSFLIYALPIAGWVGWMVGFGRLGTDGELVALASVGASPWSLVKTSLGVGALLLVGALYICEFHYGQGRLAFQHGISELARQAAGRSLQPGTVAQLSDELWLATADVEGGSPPVFIVREPDVVMSVAAARPATATPGFELEQGIAFFRAATDPTVIRFGSGFAEIDALAIGAVYASSRERSLSELWAGRNGRKGRHYLSELHQRLALSFALILAPMAAFAAAPRRARSSRGRSVVASLAGFLIYYGLFTAGKQAAIKGWLPPELGLWAGNVFLAVVATIVLLHKSNRPGLP